MRRIFKIVFAGVTATGLLAGAPKPKVLREINLNAIIHESGALLPSTHSVQGLAFSPDEKWIAVGVGRHWKPGSHQMGDQGVSHLLVVPVNAESGQNLQIDPGLWVPGDSLQWSPDSSTVLFAAAPPKWYAVPGGELWKQGQPDGRLTGVPGFVDMAHGLAYEAGLHASFSAHEPTVLDTFDLAGRIVDTWRSPGPWIVVAVSPDRHLLAVSEETATAAENHYIFDYRTKTVVRRWPGEFFPQPYFAEGGKTVCSVQLYGRGSPHAQCWDVDSGDKVSEFSGFSGGQPASVSSHGSRVLLTHVRVYRGITEEHDLHSFHNRIVWDFRTGKEVVAWVPMTQVRETGLNPPEDKATGFGLSVLSPSGRYVAEGSNGRKWGQAHFSESQLQPARAGGRVHPARRRQQENAAGPRRHDPVRAGHA
jgi:hypothetical protein